MGYLMLKPSLEKNSKDAIQTKAGGGNMGVHTFPKSICPKVNIEA